MSVTFTTTLDTGPGPIGITVPEEAMAALGPAKRYPVVVTIGGYTYRNSVSWYKGAYRIAFSGEHEKASGVTRGDTVEVSLEIDDAPRVVEIPDALKSRLADAGVLERFTALSYSKQRALVDPWVAAKSDATRDKNLAKMIEAAG
ncbi:YdeI/OmpD-associated family protein [Antiquaquibacter soli]|uniref:YdeI/OmpD-associated family protein n=1 Tax=Antiquaquibacter soli TaxID=3064523 RepID=A0ABT9BJM3_9MICO|nr:YdeI/OmpD-associated family protein [Protaetiibacter sp. WY-16]MDO7881223.1 YdeI/OmpD-associated family protein [Protaetiibacter sp. WY-16]